MQIFGLEDSLVYRVFSGRVRVTQTSHVSKKEKVGVVAIRRNRMTFGRLTCCLQAPRLSLRGCSKRCVGDYIRSLREAFLKYAKPNSVQKQTGCAIEWKGVVECLEKCYSYNISQFWESLYEGLNKDNAVFIQKRRMFFIFLGEKSYKATAATVVDYRGQGSSTQALKYRGIVYSGLGRQRKVNA